MNPTNSPCLLCVSIHGISTMSLKFALSVNSLWVLTCIQNTWGCARGPQGRLSGAYASSRLDAHKERPVYESRVLEHEIQLYSLCVRFPPQRSLSAALHSMESNPNLYSITQYHDFPTLMPITGTSRSIAAIGIDTGLGSHLHLPPDHTCHKPPWIQGDMARRGSRW